MYLPYLLSNCKHWRCFRYTDWYHTCNHQAQVVQRVDNFIQRINHYSGDKDNVHVLQLHVNKIQVYQLDWNLVICPLGPEIYIVEKYHEVLTNLQL